MHEHDAMKMKIREYTVRFETPAFLGDADQRGRWRTPPFKHLLREWWRVAWAEENDPADWQQMRAAESALFGAAADNTGTRSQLRIRLQRWDAGNLQSHHWKALCKVEHPEVGFEVDAGLYLGYGPVAYDKKNKSAKLNFGAAINAGEQTQLRMAFPEEHARLLERAVTLINAFGTLGSRSRNGWGSLTIADANAVKAIPSRDWLECLGQTWAHAIGKDEKGPLVWDTRQFEDWKSLVCELAQIKIGLRTQKPLQFTLDAAAGDKIIKGKVILHGGPQGRHWLGYPVTNHEVASWKRANARLPNSLRFKIFRDDQGKLRGRIFHMPCLPPERVFQPDRNVLQTVWLNVHRYLDGLARVQRAGQ